MGFQNYAAILLSLLFLLGITQASDQNVRKGVQIELNANWRPTPLVLEISEFLATEGKELFWKMAAELPSTIEGKELLSLTEKDQYLQAYGVAKQLLSPVQMDLLEYSMALRYYSPKVEMYRQLYSTFVGENDLQQQIDQTEACQPGFAFYNNQIYCTLSQLQNALQSGVTETTPLEIYDFDHCHHAKDRNVPAVLLFSTLGSKHFKEFHNYLESVSNEGSIHYCLRHYVPNQEGTMNLGGYGVELAIKSLEYKAVDDRKVEGEDSGPAVTIDESEEDIQGFLFGTLQKRKPHLSSELAAFKAYLSTTDTPFEELKVWHLKDIGYQASQRIVSATNPLELMAGISQNFPTLAPSLSKVKVDNELKTKLTSNRIVEPGRNVVLLNGRVVDPTAVDPYNLYHILREESTKLDSITKLHIPQSAAFKLLSTPAEKDTSDVFNISSQSIIFLNDLEKDQQYGNWRNHIGDIFMRVWPGSFRYVAKNFFTLVVVIDPSSLEDLMIAGTLENFINQNIPFRFGVLLTTNSYSELVHKSKLSKNGDIPIEDNNAVKISRAILHAKNTIGPRAASFYLSTLLTFSSETGDVNMDNAFQAYSHALSRYGKKETRESFNQIVESSEYDATIQQANKFVLDVGISQTPAAFFNGAPVEASSPDGLFQSAAQEYFPQTSQLQEAVRGALINPRTDIYQWLLSRPHVLPRYNNLVLPSAESNPVQFVNLATVDSREDTVLRKNTKYFTSTESQDATKAITHLVCLDTNSPYGLELALESLLQLKTTLPFHVRVGWLSNPATPGQHSVIAQALQFVLGTHTLSRGLTFAEKVLSSALAKDSQSLNVEDILEVGKEAGVKLERLEKFLKDSDSSERTQILQELNSQQSFCESVFHLQPGDSAIITNGRFINLSNNPSFLAADFNLLSNYEYNRRSKKVVEEWLNQETPSFEGLEADEQTSDFISDVVMKVVSVLGLDEQKGIQKIVLPPGELQSTFTVRSKRNQTQQAGDNASFIIVAILNPLSVAAQRITPILSALVERFDCRVDVVLNPVEHSELPLKNFYQYVIPTQLEFDQTGRYLGPNAVFSYLPAERLLTLIMDTPESWLVTPTVAKYDLDNIKLADIKEKVLYAQFDLQHILAEGNCYQFSQMTGMNPPRGLELVLGTNVQPHQVDTIVMSNFGYFQLKAKPGVFSLQLKSNSRSSELFDIAKPLTTQSLGKDERSSPPYSYFMKEITSEDIVARSRVIVDDFNGYFQFLRVHKKPGKERDQLLTADEKGGEHHGHAEGPNGGIWDSLSNYFGKEGEVVQHVSSNETIHIFSLATGHLYERFLKIMMLSVVHRTQQPVKFWLLANFLSPKFMESVPYLASKYNFSYQFVTYKWPSWLHKQTEKQRIIWGYKILFLDVLFPLDLKKVIYVDADQVVRADLKELWELDLRGAPYAYTPFCDDNKEMDGFRFWKQGFWQNHLRGLPYHISALYVVDLAQFRRLAAGDNLRATYASLSQDPNSLANLDQDLPNYLQHMVKIHSLPQEWLWCETWCSQDSKPRAKTIDLCNNPLTKTPKLQNAVRILPEWTDLDNEAQQAEREYYTLKDQGKL